MMRLLVLLALTAQVAPAAAQAHHHAAPTDTAGVAEVFTVDGLRVDAAAPPPGSAVARAAIRWADGGYATVVYGRPYARGRTVFGGVVEWGAVWAAGAHRATEMWTTVPLAVGDTVLAPGGSSLLATPRADRWTLHVNRALGAHLSDTYDPALDLVTVDVAPSALDAPVEALTYTFAPDGRALVLRWAHTEVALPLARVLP